VESSATESESELSNDDQEFGFGDTQSMVYKYINVPYEYMELLVLSF